MTDKERELQEKIDELRKFVAHHQTLEHNYGVLQAENAELRRQLAEATEAPRRELKV